MSNKINGACLCGLIEYELDEDFKAFYQCHCKQCQILTGSAFASNLFTDPQNISWLRGEDSVVLYEHPSRKISKSFCRSCGSAVPFVNKSKTSLIVPAGSLTSAIEEKVHANIFMSEKACWSRSDSSVKSYDLFPD
jgi:hypothetical protein